MKKITFFAENMFARKISKNIAAGLIFGAAVAAGIALTLAFTEPISGPSGFDEPENFQDQGDWFAYGRGWSANSGYSAPCDGGDPDGSCPLTKAACEAAYSSTNYYWKWFEDGNGDGDYIDEEDGVCVLMCTGATCSDANTANGTNNYSNDAYLSVSWNGAEQTVTTLTTQTATSTTANSITVDGASWTTDAYKDSLVDITSGSADTCWGRIKTNNSNTITIYGSTWLDTSYAACSATPAQGDTFAVRDDDKYDNSWIGDWACTGNFPTGVPSWGSYPTSAQVGSNYIALATADCLDGKRDLLPTVDESASDSRIVYSGTAESGDGATLTDDNAAWDNNVWIGQKVKIFSGTSANSTGTIESNTATVLTVGSWSAGNPGSDSQYGIIYIVPHSGYRPNFVGVATENNGPLQAENLKSWRGSRLPSSQDFFGVCGNGSSDKTIGSYGVQIGRTDEYLNEAGDSLWDWLSEPHNSYSARVAGHYGCSGFGYDDVSHGYRFRAVFRP